MERLFAYLLVLYTGFDIKDNYEEYLHNQFLRNPQDELLLELEFLSNDIERTDAFLKENIDFTALDNQLLAKEIVDKLKICYENMPFDRFISKTYILWCNLPYELSHDEPLFELRFAEDPYSYGVDIDPEEIIEDILNFFD